jgi:hypothetical protein
VATCITGLQARPAAPVQLDAGHLHGQARVERHHPADRRGLRGRVAVAEDHVVDRVAGHPGAVEQGAYDGRAQIRCRHVLQGPAEAAHRRAQRLADDDVHA